MCCYFKGCCHRSPVVYNTLPAGRQLGALFPAQSNIGLRLMMAVRRHEDEEGPGGEPQLGSCWFLRGTSSAPWGRSYSPGDDAEDGGALISK